MNRRHLALAALALTGLVGSASAQSSQEAVAIHRRMLVLDAHADILLPSTPKRYAGPDGTSQVSVEKLVRGGVDAIVLEVATLRGPPTAEGVAAARALAEEKLAYIRALPAQSNDRIALALSADDVERIAAEGRIALLIGFQGFYALGPDLDAIDAFAARGVRVFNFTHAGHNLYADSSRPVAEPVSLHGGLSPLGRQAVARLNDLGVLIDVSQLTPEGVQQVVTLSKAPVIATHSAVRRLIDNSRNLADAEIRAIAAKGGVIGVTAFSGYLTSTTAAFTTRLTALRAKYGLPANYVLPYDGMMDLSVARREAYLDELTLIGDRATLREYVDHIAYIAKLVGVDHVAIGTDFNHGAGVTGFADASDAGAVTAELLKRGFTPAEIGKIWSGNFLRVLRAAERGRVQP